LPNLPPKHAELLQPLTEEEMEELDAFLTSKLVAEETMMINTLDGYMTALVIGPAAVALSGWLPGVWGPRAEDAPEFESNKQASRVLTLMLRHMNGIAGSFEEEPEAFEPMFDLVSYEEGGQEYVDGEMWAMGFMHGVALREDDWRPLLEDAQGREWMRPLHLLGSPVISPEEEELVGSPELREALAKQIPASLAAIHAYWLPRRLVSDQQDEAAAPVKRDGPKVGRNDLCPCGSGKKFKKCCGAATSLH